MNGDALAKAVDKLFERYTAPGSPGCAVGVMKEGELLFKAGYGLANVEHRIPNTPSTVFNIGSEAKQFTAMAILLLAAEGKLALDDLIRQHLPESPAFGETITVRHLVHHTSGLRCSFPPLLMLGGWLEPDLVTNDDVYRLFLAQQALNFPPGEEFSYANMGYIVLARIVERASGQPFATFCRERIFQPLGMSSTCIQDSPGFIIPHRAQSYWLDDGKLFNAYLADSVCGPTNVYTSIEDLALWDENFTSGKVGGSGLIEQMQQPGRLNDGTELDYAFGLMVGHRHRGLDLVEHGGGHGGYVSALIRFPDVHFSVAVLFNLFHWQFRDDALKVADIFLDALGYGETPGYPEADAPGATGGASDDGPGVELEEAVLAAWAGLYFDAKRVALREFSFVDGELRLGDQSLRPLDGARFVLKESPNVQVDFAAASGDQPAEVQIISHMNAYRYQRVVRVNPPPAALADYEGQYHCPELNLYWKLVLAGDHLIVQRQRYRDTRLTAVFADAFKDDWSPVAEYPVTYFIQFQRDDDGAVTGFAVSDDRMRNLRFFRQTLA
jgi:CubicO group peptidase (beta-lactamase class C family)